MEFYGVFLSILLFSWVQDASAAPRKDLAFPPNAEPVADDPDPDFLPAEAQDPEIKDRINLFHSRGHANAYGPGGMSQSDALNEGVEIGIHRAGQMDESLYDDNRSYGSSNFYGAAPPRTWAGAHNQHGYGYNRGGAEAGFSGGIGNAQTHSMNQHIEIPIGDGAVLFSNLHTKKQGSKTDPSKNSNLSNRHVIPS